MRWFSRMVFRPFNLFWIILVLAVGLALPYLPLADIWEILSGLRPHELGILAGFNLLIVSFLSSRWWWILRLLGYRLSFLRLAAYRLAGFSISYFTPGTQFGGEPLQVYLLEKREDVPRASAVASVALDKMVELLANLSFLSIGALFVFSSGVLIGGVSPAWLVVWVAGALSLPLGYLLALWSGRRPLTWLAGKLPVTFTGRVVRARVQPVLSIAEDQILTFFRQRPSGLMVAFLFSGITWMMLIFEYWLLLSFLGGDPGIRQTITGMTAARLAFMTPVPGGLGALEAGQVLAAQLMGFGPALGLSASLLIRGRDVSLGLLGLGLGIVLSRSPLGDPLPSKPGSFH